jgi:hypothetical protein
VLLGANTGAAGGGYNIAAEAGDRAMVGQIKGLQKELGFTLLHIGLTM